jgi:hypothetical protein
LNGRTLLLLKESIEFLVEGSALYLDVLSKAKSSAKGNQLSFKQYVCLFVFNVFFLCLCGACVWW